MGFLFREVPEGAAVFLLVTAFVALVPEAFFGLALAGFGFELCFAIDILILDTVKVRINCM